MYIVYFWVNIHLYHGNCIMYIVYFWVNIHLYHGNLRLMDGAQKRSIRTMLFTKKTAAQNVDALSYHIVRGLYFLAVVFVENDK